MTISDEDFRRTMAFIHAELVVQRIAIHHIMDKLSKADLLDFEGLIAKINNLNAGLDKSGPILSESRLFKDIMAQANPESNTPVKWRPVVVAGADFQDIAASENDLQGDGKSSPDEPSR
jgi:hypothetical protein